MTEATIFTATTDDTVTQTTTTPQFTLPQEVSELVGEGKKYKSVEDALKSVPHAQKHISEIEQEMAQLREELAKRKTAEELLDEIKSGIKPVEQPSNVGISSDTVTQAVEQALAKQEQQQKAAKNISTVTSMFSGKFGDKAEEVYNALAQEAGLSVQMMNQLAATSPTAVLKMAGLLEKKENVAGKMQSSVNTDSLTTATDTSTLSARVKPGATSKDLREAWKVAGQKIGKPT